MTATTVCPTRDDVRQFDLLWGVIAVLQLADVVTTTTALRLVGASEGNPLAQGIVQHPWLLLAVKTLVTAFGWWVMRAGVIHGRGTSYAWGCWGGSVLILVAYSVIVVNNTQVLFG